MHGSTSESVAAPRSPAGRRRRRLPARSALRAALLGLVSVALGMPAAALAAPEAPAAAVPGAAPATTPEATPEALAAELARLRARIAELEAWKEAQELERLAESADAAAEQAPPETLERKTFKGGERALQALNPELSVTGDLAFRAVFRHDQDFGADPPTNFTFRGIGLHVQSNLDPFSFMKAAISFSPDGVAFGEAYVTWTNVLPHLNVTAGKFHQQLGVVNRWHRHGLDTYDFPLMLAEPFGGGALNQIGVAFEWFMPALWAHEQALQLQVTNGMNGKVFQRDGALASVPAVLLRLQNYWDLDRDTYLELGLTGVLGWNNAHSPDYKPAGTAVVELPDAAGNPVRVLGETAAVGQPNSAWHVTAFAAADLTLAWEPLNRAKYAGVTWRSEFLYARKELPGGALIETYGGYTGLEGRVWQNWHVGVRGDLVERFAYGKDDELLWQVAPYVTWWQSPWVRLHLEYEYLDGTEAGFRREHRAILQAVFAAGPHKHDRY